MGKARRSESFRVARVVRQESPSQVSQLAGPRNGTRSESESVPEAGYWLRQTRLRLRRLGTGLSNPLSARRPQQRGTAPCCPSPTTWHLIRGGEWHAVRVGGAWARVVAEPAGWSCLQGGIWRPLPGLWRAGMPPSCAARIKSGPDLRNDRAHGA
jgi:hypothetical protein